MGDEAKYASWAVGGCTRNDGDGESTELVRVSVETAIVFLTPDTARQMATLLLLQADKADVDQMEKEAC